MDVSVWMDFNYFGFVFCFVDLVFIIEIWGGFIGEVCKIVDLILCMYLRLI